MQAQELLIGSLTDLSAAPVAGNALFLWLVLWVWNIICGAAFLYCSYVDLRTQRIPNRVTYPLLLVSAPLTLLCGQWPAALWGGLLAGGLLFVPRLIWGPDKAGMGDVKLAMLGGLLVGPLFVIVALSLAFLSAVVVLTPLLVLKRLGLRDPVAFGPFLSFGFVLALVLLWPATPATIF